MRFARFVVEEIEQRRLLSGGTISGVIFDDLNADGVRQAATESQLPGWAVFLDTNGNGFFDAGHDVRTVADANGRYRFTGLSPGTYHVAETPPSGWRRTAPVNPSSYTVTLAANATVSNRNFGNVRTASGALDPNGTLVITGSAKADVVDVELSLSNLPDPANDHVTVTFNGATHSFPPAQVQAIFVNVLGGDDDVTVDEFGQNSIPATLLGGDGNDGLGVYMNNDLSTDALLVGGNGNDTLLVSSEEIGLAATLDGGHGNDTLTSEGVEELDVLFLGGPGNDQINSSDGTAATISGGAGVDTLAEDADEGGVDITLDNVANDSINDYPANIMSDVETINLLDAGDVRIIGSSAPINNVFTIEGAFTADLEGGGGNDVLQTKNIANATTLRGGSGNDLLNAADDAPDPGAVLDGGPGDDTVIGGEGNDTLDGGAGSDTMIGGGGIDVADYHARTANLVVWLDGSHPGGQSGENDHFDGTTEIVYGGSGNDYLVGTKGNNALFGNGGNDTIFGGGGVDAFFGGAGNDQIHSKNGNKDYVDGGSGNDSAQTDAIDTVVNVETVTH